MAVKHAIKSTEFYLAALSVCLLGINLFLRIPSEIASNAALAVNYSNVNTICSTVGILGVVGLYVVGRSLVKRNCQE